MADLRDVWSFHDMLDGHEALDQIAEIKRRLTPSR